MTKTKDDAFGKVGFTNGKKAPEKLEKSQNMATHHEAADLVVKIPSTTKNVGEMLNTSYASQKKIIIERCSWSYLAVFTTWVDKVLLYVGGTKQMMIQPLEVRLTLISCSYLDYVLKTVQAFSSG